MIKDCSYCGYNYYILYINNNVNMELGRGVLAYMNQRLLTLRLNTLRKFLYLGIIGVVINVVHVVLGGYLWNGYNHLMQPISDLTAIGAPNRITMTIIVMIYNICMIFFSISTYLYARDYTSKLTKLGMKIYMIMHLLTLFIHIFPQDLRRPMGTLYSIIHMGLFGIILILTLIVLLLIVLGLMNQEEFYYFAIFSLVISVIFIITMLLFTFFFFLRLPYVGLIEKINVGAFQLWTLILSFKLIKTTSKTI